MEKRLPNSLDRTLSLLAPYRQEIADVAVESTFNWYWLVDGMMDQGYSLHLVNTAAVKQYEGLKHTEDRYDALPIGSNCTSGVPFKKARNCTTVFSCCSFMSITMGVMIDPNASLQAHTSLEIRAPVRDQTILE